MTDTKTFYEILDVAETANADEIKRAYYRLVRKKRPDEDPEAFNMLKEAYEVLSDVKRRKEYDQRRLYGEKVEALLNSAREAMEDNPMIAVRLCKEAVVLSPDWNEPRLLLSRALWFANDHAGSEAEARRLALENPNSAFMHYILAQNLWLQDKNDDAVISVLKALAIDPQYYDAWILLAKSHRDAGKMVQSVEAFEKAIVLTGTESLPDLTTLIEILRIYVLEKDKSGIGRTENRIYALLTNEEDEGNYVVYMLRRLAIEFLESKNYGGAYMVLQCIRPNYITDNDLRAAVDETNKYVGLLNEASSMLDDEQVPKSIKALVYCRYFDEEDEISEDEKEALFYKILDDAKTNPHSLVNALNYIAKKYKNFSTDNSNLLRNLWEVTNETNTVRNEPTIVSPSLESSLPRQGPNGFHDASHQSTTSPSSGSCFGKVVVVVILIALAPLILTILGYLLPVLLGLAVIATLVWYFFLR